LVREKKEIIRNPLINMIEVKKIIEDRVVSSMDKKKNFKLFLEKYFNNHKKKEIELYYGVGTKISVSDVVHSHTNKLIMVDLKIILGPVINEEVLDREIIDYMTQEILNVLYPEYPTKTMVSWDV